MTVSAEPGYRIVWDDFKNGFAVGAPGDADALWFYYGFGPYVGDDGIVETSGDGLRVRSSGTNPSSGEPAFVRTLAQESVNGSGMPGTLEHVKWLAFTNRKASSGVNGFDAEPGAVLTFETWMTGRTFGTAGHPFGEHVTNPDDDMRLASVGMPLLDEETSVIVDFFLSNEQVYVVYERLPFSRQQMGNYAAFVYQIPVARRTPDQEHHFTISYDRAAGLVRWLLDGTEVYTVDKIGCHLDSRQYLMVDHGGDEVCVEPRQLNAGMGMFASLDYAAPGRTALVRVSDSEGYYYSTETGPPAPQRFLDDKSLETNRLFGQGAQIGVRRYVVSSTPVGT
jgi:uncharacterized protein DUF6081